MSDCKRKRLGRIVEAGLVAVIRAESCEQAIRIAGACADGGIAALEVTFTVPRSAAVIEDLLRSFKAGET
jgi:2-dehydro-3-deoxyphosphogluconate aldolase/(4S)-4-hydroxy-2-oxoglutarate aldolase